MQKTENKLLDTPPPPPPLTLRINHLPPELLEAIFASLPLQTIITASEVCTRWNKVIRCPLFWKRLYNYKKTAISWERVHTHANKSADEWAVHFAVCRHNLFARNLLINPYGEVKKTGKKVEFVGWKILSGEERNGLPTDDDYIHLPRPGWTTMKKEEQLVANFPGGNEKGLLRCFVTDENSCSKEQKVDLWGVGFTPAVMRAVVPFTIKWSVFVGTPPNHEGYYDMQIRLLSSGGEDVLESKHSAMTESISLKAGTPFTRVGGGYTVHKGEEEFEIVNKQLRFVYFYHGGMAKDNQSGYNGPRIYGPSVEIWI